jgi:hypothetical protein
MVFYKEFVHVLRRTPRNVYELEDLQGESIDGQFYADGPTRVKNTRT